MAWYETLEQEFAGYIGVGDVISTNTGTSALHLAIAGRHYPEGSRIIVPEFSMIATALAPWYARCEPVYVDCLDDMNIDAGRIREKIDARTVAVMITHVYGRICSMEPILEICEEFGLDLFEDCCEVHGAVYHDGPCAGQKVGSLGTGCFSFYRNKIVAAEEGGAVCVRDDPEYAAHLRDLKSMSFGKEHNYVHQHIGFNYRMPDAQAELACKSLRQIAPSLSHRQQVAAWYDAALDDVFLRPPRNVVWVYDINCRDPQILVKALNAQGIQARRCFAPMSMQPCFGVRPGYEKLRAYQLYMSTCYLPVTASMNEAEVNAIADTVNAFR